MNDEYMPPLGPDPDLSGEFDWWAAVAAGLLASGVAFGFAVWWLSPGSPRT